MFREFAGTMAVICMMIIAVVSLISVITNIPMLIAASATGVSIGYVLSVLTYGLVYLMVGK